MRLSKVHLNGANDYN